MRAISLWEPWASLIDSGAKTMETRSWPAPEGLVGQKIAIHAAQRAVKPILKKLTDREAAAFWAALNHGPDWRGSLGDTNLPRAYLNAHPWPLGHIVCVCKLLRCHQVARHDGGYAVFHDMSRARMDPFGDYSIGRWVWVLEWVASVRVQIAGKQGLWLVPPPTVEAMRAQARARA